MNCILKKYILLTIFMFIPIIVVNASDLEIMPIDYVTGDCTLLKSGNEYLLIDVGQNKVEVIDSKLSSNNITKETPINIYLSHYHKDHFGGDYNYKTELTIDGKTEEYDVYSLGYLIANYNVKSLYLPKPFLEEVNKEEDTTIKKNMQAINKYYKRFSAVAQKYNVNVITLEKDSKFSFGNTSAEVLYLDRNINYENKDAIINNSSLVTMFKNGKTKFLTAGDIQHEVEEKILAENIDISADIFKLSHHGYWKDENYSNTKNFIEAVKPKYFYMQIRYSLLKYDTLKDSLPQLLSFSNMYSNVDIASYKNGEKLPNGDIKFIILEDEITPIMEKNSYTITINYIDESSNEIMKTKNYDFSATEIYHLYDYKKTFEGYSLSKGESDIIQTGTLKSNKIYNVYYNKNNYKLTIKHVDENGNILLEEQKEYKYKESYTAQPSEKLLSEYDLLDETNNKTGIITENTTITYAYSEKKQLEPNVDDKTEIEIPDSAPTRDVPILFVVIVGIIALIYFSYYLVKNKKHI